MRTFWQSKLGILAVVCGGASLMGCNSSEFLRNESRQEAEEKSASLAPKVKRTNVFVGGKTENSSITIKPFFNEASSRVNLVNAINDRTQSVVRPRIERLKRFQQGQVGNVGKDVYNQDDYGVLDVLFVIDNSKSMKREQRELSQKLGSFLSFVGDSNWKIALISTDLADGGVPSSFISRRTRNFRNVFANRVSRFGTHGSSDERGYFQAYRAIKDARWIRSDSSLAVVIVSDEDECSDGRNCRTGNIGAVAAKNRLVNLLNQRGNSKIFGLITTKTSRQGNCSIKGGNRVGNLYRIGINATGGVFGSICANSYDDVLREISRGVSTTLRRQYRLSRLPIDGTLSITVGGQPFTGRFSRKGRTVTLHSELPSKGTDIAFNYRYGSSTVLKRFDLGQQISANFLSVFVGGNELSRDQWQLTDNQFIDFADAPAEGSEVLVRFRDRGQRFAINFNNPKYVRGSLKLSLNGKPYRGYSLNNGQIRFNRGIRDNSRIDLSYQLSDGAKLRYPFASKGGRVKLDRAYYADRPDVTIPVIFENDEVIVPQDDFRLGQDLVIATFEDSGTNSRFDLGRTPVGSAMKLSVLAGKGCSANDLKIDGNWLDVDCDVDPNSAFQVDFKAFAQPSDLFALDLAAGETAENVTVRVNGQVWEDFTVSGNRVSFTKRAPADCQVAISFETQNF